MNKTKVLVIFPKYDDNDSSHYPYWYRVFEEAGNELDIAVIFETATSYKLRATSSQLIKNCKTEVLPNVPKPFNLLNRLTSIYRYIGVGYTNIYIHYSYWSVILARILKVFHPEITIYYWDCEFYSEKPNNLLLELAIKWSDVLVTGSPMIADQYIKIYSLKPKTENLKPRTQIVPNWSEHIPVEKIDLPNDQIHILFVHHLSPRKGSRELPTIIQETLKQVPTAHFHIIGDGPDREWLEEQVSSFTLQASSSINTNMQLRPRSSKPEARSNISFYGNLPLSEVRRYFASCNYFIMPSRSEGFPNKIERTTKLSLPWSSANPAVAGLVAEHAALISETSMAEEMLSPWLDTKLWAQFKLLSQGMNAYIRTISPYSTAKIMKETSNVIYAMTCMGDRYEQELAEFIEKLILMQDKSGGFYCTFDTKIGRIINSKFDKTQNFTCIDLLVALSEVFPQNTQLITASVKAANFWLNQKDQQTNLIPDYLSSNGKPLYSIAKLDQSADLYSSFLRLYDLTHEKKYLIEAEIGAEAMRTSFGKSEWWSRIVNTETGKPATDNEVPPSDRPAGINMTKYIGGALRFYLSLYLVKNGISINKDPTLSCLSRDR